MSGCNTMKLLLMVSVCLLLEDFLNQKVTAFQDPHIVTALKGGTVTIDCLHGLNNTEGMAVTLQRNATLCYKVIGNYSTWKEQCNERVNMTWNNKTNTLSLIIKALILNDSGNYTCKLDRVIPPPTQSITENKTFLQVTARPNIGLVYVNSSNGSTQLVCTSEGFSPKHIEVSWFKDGELISNDAHEENLTSNDDGSFTLTSYCSVSGSGDYTCQVNHSTLQSPLNASVTVPAHEDNQIRILLHLQMQTHVLLNVVFFCSLHSRYAFKHHQNHIKDTA
ncbi:tyrosine-protein phosphatase non-receptor type substrate 1-like [Acipenser oxyrinchus oxyrinchus]|uniref:Tyrosine-protein phosphatase non-receptor type substrate 1-like n=1 Tax=Acipenser oxyrinchus oxyrinchus TaxID=40147 RepID=A0AAD8DI55_ACIOX|nr:tyrosine-protein phosphatase non-receptor type substrate 1-like [Acipenser oxyrinchus oxyrinchus]